MNKIFELNVINCLKNNNFTNYNELILFLKNTNINNNNNSKFYVNTNLFSDNNISKFINKMCNENVLFINEKGFVDFNKNNNEIKIININEKNNILNEINLINKKIDNNLLTKISELDNKLNIILDKIVNNNNEDLENNNIIRVKSKSEKNKYYTLDLNKRTCTCPHFKYRQVECKHLKEYS